MKRSDQPLPQPSPAPAVGTPAEQTEHRPPAPTPTQHNATIEADRAAGQLSRAW